MAARPGEDNAATLFADVHYYYGPPSAKPPHHRFDKGSYVYLFENAGQRRARIEIANNAGTPDQDAFTGYLDGAHVQYSYKHTNLVTMTVDGQNGQRSPSADSQEWHLPTYDPRNENKYMYRLHTVEMYFWTKEDAQQLVSSIRRVLPTQQVSIQDEPVVPPPQHQATSSVVQKLENIAISDPSYQHGQTRDSRTTTMSFPGPPPISATPQSQEASNFAPMAYNPAAPAAPEAIKHREKTPPPEDGAGNPLMAAASSDQGQAIGLPYQQRGFSGPPTQQPQASYFAGPPGPATAPPSQSSQPPPSAGLQSPFAQHFQNTFAPPPSAPAATNPYAQPPPPAVAPPPAYQQQPATNIPVTQFANYPGSPGLHSGMTTPGIYSPGMTSPLASPGIYSPGAPPGGFSQFNYGNQISNTAPLTNDYSVHQMVYRPTETEMSHGYKPAKPAKPPAGKLEARAGQVEKGINSLFKKMEKKLG